MIGAGIEDGDLVVVRQQPTAEPGQIVVALVEDEVTLKRFFPDPENGCVRLHPENKKLKDIIVDGVSSKDNRMGCIAGNSKRSPLQGFCGSRG